MDFDKLKDMKKFYEKMPNGVIHQKEFFHQIKEYNKEYSSKYDKYGEMGRHLGFLRLGFLISSIGKIPDSILDVGYGNGDFLKASSITINKCYGTDITKGPLPDNVQYLNWGQAKKEKYDVVTFFDSLEHFEDIEFVKNLNCDYIFITLPWCHYKSDKWFFDWKHRRPDEHLWHFNKESLINFFEEQGYSVVNCGVPLEDAIRKDERYNPNILTGIFKKKY